MTDGNNRTKGDHGITGHLFRGLLEAAPDAMVIPDRKVLAELASSQTAKIYGYNRAELLEQRVEMLIPHEFHDSHLAHHHSYYYDPDSGWIGPGLEFRGWLKLNRSPTATGTR